MKEADNLSEAGQFDRSNAALDKVRMLLSVLPDLSLFEPQPLAWQLAIYIPSGLRLLSIELSCLLNCLVY